MPVAPTRDGYEFVGWATDAAGELPWDATAPVTASMTVYAQWSAVAPVPPATPPVTPPGSAPTPASATPTALPNTGIDGGGLLAGAVALLVVGAVLMRRRYARAS